MKRICLPAPSTFLTNRKPIRLAATLALVGLLSSLAGVSVAHASLLGTAGEYGEFILGNSTRWSVDAHGKVAVGGNADFTGGFAVATQQPTSTTNLVVGGTLNANGSSVRGNIVTGGNSTYTQPTVHGNFSSNGSLTLGNGGTVNGSVRYAASYSRNGTTVSGSETGGVTTPLPVDFAVEGAYLKALSLAQVNPLDPTPTFQWGQMFVTGGAGANFYNLTGTDLASSTGGFVINAPGGSTVVLNVSGSGFTIPNTGLTLNGGVALTDILWNFHEATALTIQGSANGSFLAPLASISTTYGAFNGNLIAASLTGQIETHTVINGNQTFFDGDLRSVVPEPASLGMLLVATIGGAGLLRRRPA